MASSSDVVKKIMRLKLQLMDTLESATVLKILQKLKDLDVTLDILAETGIGKTVNSFRRHEQAGEFAKSVVRGWKRLVPKESTSQTGDGDSLEGLFVKDKLDDKDCQNDGSSLMEDLNNNFSNYRDDSQNCLDQVLFKTGSRKANSEKDYEDQIRQKHNGEKHNDSKEKAELRKDKSDNSVVSKEKRYDQNNRKSGDYGSLLGSKNTEDTQQKKARPDSKDKMKSNPDRGRLKDSKESFSFESREKHSKPFKVSSDKDERSPGTWRSSEAQNGKRKKASEEKDAALKPKQECGHKQQSNTKKKKSKTKPKEERGLGKPSMSFESYLNYDTNVLKRKNRSGVKKPPKVIKTAEREATTDPGVDAFKSSAASLISEKQLQESVMELMNASSPVLPEYEKPISVEYFERKVEKESNFCDLSEESAVFTGQRLNRKMQVYSGAKTISLPTMMSLHQQCIRALQNNINLLYETGGVPFDILEPVLERCTPEQLLRIEEYNPIYVGATDHLWGRHCQRDFKDAKLQEYESWKEMYIRLSEERELKLKRLTKSIVSAQSNKPKGRQVKMAFIHTAAKPPRDVRIQQEIHGTAVQQPPQLRCSVKVPDNRSRSSCNEHSRSSSNASGSSSTQDPRKKTRVAPMMAKSLKAFKKQLGRR